MSPRGRPRLGDIGRKAAEVSAEGGSWCTCSSSTGLAPLAGSEPVEVAADEVGKYLADLPRGVVDLRKYGTLALSPINHSELALLCLIARYGPCLTLVRRDLRPPDDPPRVDPPPPNDDPLRYEGTGGE